MGIMASLRKFMAPTQDWTSLSNLSLYAKDGSEIVRAHTDDKGDIKVYVREGNPALVVLSPSQDFPDKPSS